MLRPCIESSEIWYSRVRRSFGVIAASVARGVHVRGPSSGQTGRVALEAVCCAEAEAALANTSARSAAERTR